MKQRALITGGSSGIGLALSGLFAVAGYDLIWVSDDASQLKQSAEKFRQQHPGCNVQTLCYDLSDVQVTDEIFSKVMQDGPVDVLVNAAGFGTFGPMLQNDQAREMKMMALNMTAVYRLTRIFAADMASRDSGRIVNISSTTSLQPVPDMAVYAATKSFVRQFSLSFADELRRAGSRVTVTTVLPPATTGTAFMQVAGMEGVRTFTGLQAATVNEVARDAFEGAMKGRRIVYAGSRLRMTRLLASVLPAFVIRRLVQYELSRR